MAKHKLTEEEQKILGSDEEDFQFVTSGPWKRIKQKLMAKVVLNDSLSSFELSGKTDEQLVRELVGKAQATQLIFEWIREIENNTLIHTEARTAMQEIREDIFFHIDERSENIPHN